MYYIQSTLKKITRVKRERENKISSNHHSFQRDRQNDEEKRALDTNPRRHALLTPDGHLNLAIIMKCVLLGTTITTTPYHVYRKYTRYILESVLYTVNIWLVDNVVLYSVFLVSSSVEKRKSDPDDTESSIVFYFFFLFLCTFVSFILFHSCLFSFVTHGSSKWKSFPPFGLHLLLTFQQVLESFHERKLCGWLCKPIYIKRCCPIIFIQAVTRKSEEEQENIQDGIHILEEETTVDGKTRNKFVRQEMP